MQIHDATETARLLAYPRLIAALEKVLPAYQRGEINSPERLVVPVGGGTGMLLSMPCSAPDLIAHKLVTIYNGNPSAGLPALQGQVTCLDATNGRALFVLDGPTVTARRTAAISMLGIQRLRATPPRTALLIGVGAQGRAHAEALLQLFPGIRIAVRARRPEAVRAFCAALNATVRPAEAGDAEAAEVVIAATSSKQPVYDRPARPECLVIGVGAYRLDMVEIGAPTITGSQVYVDDPVGAPVEAGDVVAAGTDWAGVRPLATALETRPDFSRPVFLKSVGCAAWDLAACRAAREALG
ncbi:delta(1)-pyrroline-2-carboxylate reductase family protein [Roseomonas sp. M0104]|uniref:Delta(1)-pyrroline-2-carboxylate reductase family protein n=1 Tax=Teichococcus coralli TaxID=2545983 RepID=A0A845B800_9PROT|nr:delta(1)-pyrroline-2-carboxylate reductase family protein [Pseudoroseomonas coralli]MXP62835.1 delta(1)-pyrroline-2-carboxylate reductase family protein [Pseudoroseomonas coralli]